MWHCSFHSFFSNGRKRYQIFGCSFLCIYLGLHSTESTREWLLALHVKFWNISRAEVPNLGSWPSSRPLPIWYWAVEGAGKQACIHSSTYASGQQTCSSTCVSSRCARHLSKWSCMCAWPLLVQVELHASMSHQPLLQPNFILPPWSTRPKRLKTAALENENSFWNVI